MAELRRVGEWVLRQRLPQTAPPHPLIVLLHGWSGDENAMWVFAHRLPQQALLVAPRGLYPTPLGGYGWAVAGEGVPSHYRDFRPAVDALLALLTPTHFPQADLDHILWVGFSQGAALAYTLALLHPERTGALAGLAGFMPAGGEALAKDRPLRGKAVFISHGRLDDIVPLERAEQARTVLEAAGAQVFFCVDEVGHKLSADCFRGLGTFLASQLPGKV